MMTAPIVEGTLQDSQIAKPQIPPSVLIVGKKRTLDYVAPALSRINETGELVIKATGSLSIVTAVDIAEIVKRDVAGIKTQSITIGTDELRVSTGELKPMSCIQIHLAKYNPTAVVQPEVDVHVPVEETTATTAAAPATAVPIEEATSPVDVDAPVAVAANAEKAKKKPKAKRKTTATTTKKKTARKKKSEA
jgi:DNA-binding protein Alba